jgi:RHS repeat-associated protein
VHQNQRTTSGLTKNTTYYFDLSGNVTSITYPTGRIVNYTFNAANRPITAQDSASGITYVTSPATPLTSCPSAAVCYTPQGSIYSVSLGVTSSFTGVNISQTFTNRLQPNEIKASSTAGNALDLTYNFVDPVSGHNAGHVYGITNNLTTGRSQSFTYDQLNRITSAGTTATTGGSCWGYLYSYDAWANLTSQAGWSPTYNACTETTMGAVAPDGNNHIPGFSYDASGNTLNDGLYAYKFNAEGEMTTGGGVTYLYDGDGRRVSRSARLLYWYGSGGEILLETTTTGSTKAEFVYFGGKRVAMIPTSGVAEYYVEDFLGSSRVLTQNTGTVCYDADFSPFGGEQVVTNTCTQNAFKFEGKERDSETLNDDFGARYYTWRFGRWLSADWSSVPVAVPYANLTNPQTLNLYSMVADDPESFADLDGHENLGIGTQGGTANPGCAGPMSGSPCTVQGRKAVGETFNNKSNVADRTAQVQAQNPQTVVFSDRANAPPDQSKPGAATDRTVDYQAGKMDKNGHIDSHDIDRDAKITLHEKLDPNSKTSADITKEPQTKTGSYKDYQFVPAGGSYKVLRDWKVNGKNANVLDLTTHKAFRFEVTTFDTYAKPPIKTEYTNTAPF